MRKILFFCLLLLPAILSGQTREPKKWIHSYTYRYFGVREGLVQSQALVSFQDSFGYLWFATNEGVSRFDGLHFENFSQADLGITSRVKYFNQFESAIYMMTANSIIFVNPDRTIEHYPFPDSLLALGWYNETTVNGNGLYIFECQSPTQKDRTLFTFLRFDLKNKTFIRIADNLPWLSTFTIGQKVYAVTNYHIKNNRLTFYRIDGDRINIVHNIQMDPDDYQVAFRKTNRNEWFAIIDKGPEISTVCHLYQCYVENDSLRMDYRMELFSNSGRHVRLERWDEHRLLVKSNMQDDKSYLLDTDTWRFSEFPLNMLYLNQILFDRDGNVWFSSEDGVFQCGRTFFEYYQLGLGRNDNIWGVIKDSGDNVWFSSYSYGFWRVDVRGNIFPAKINYNQGDIPVYYGYMSNCEDSRGRVYQTHNEGIAIFDPAQGDPNRLNNIQTGVSLAVYHDRESGNTYFGGENKDGYKTLSVLDSNRKLSTYLSDFRFPISICRDGARKLRIGYFKGEAWFDEENRVVVPDTIPRAYTGIVSMALDDQGVLWKGTTNGMFAEDRQGIDRQISDQSVNFVLHYRDKYIIWGLKNNLYLLDLPAYRSDSTVRIREFGYYDGFDVLETGQNGASIDHEGYVWLTGGDRVIRFLPDEIMKTPPLKPFAPYLSAIYNANKDSEWSLIPASALTVSTLSAATSAIFESAVSEPAVSEPASAGALPAFDRADNYLRFDWLQASASAPDKLVFRYRLNGYSEHWSTTRERTAIFQNLPFGKFSFELQSSVDDGLQWSESVHSPALTIRKPFLLTLPGLLLIFALLAGICYLMYFLTRKVIIRKEEEKQHIAYLKHRVVLAKFIPHFTGNVLNSISYLILKNPDSARKYISKFSDFSNQTLRISDRQYRSLQEELDYSQLYLELEKLRFEENLDYTVSTDPAVNLQKKIPTMVLQTFCENAIKHGLRPKPGGGRIEISVYTEADYTVIAVEDNGIGRRAAETAGTQGSKEGLKIVRQQLDIFNRNRLTDANMQIIDLFDSNGQPAGTRFELYIP